MGTTDRWLGSRQITLALIDRLCFLAEKLEEEGEAQAARDVQIAAEALFKLKADERLAQGKKTSTFWFENTIPIATPRRS